MGDHDGGTETVKTPPVARCESCTSELERVEVEAGRRCFSCTSRRLTCNSCEARILDHAYICAKRPKPCKYSICVACFNLGPGEGGFSQTAESFQGDFHIEGAPQTPAPSSNNTTPHETNDVLAGSPSDAQVCTGPPTTSGRSTNTKSSNNTTSSNGSSNPAMPFAEPSSRRTSKGKIQFPVTQVEPLPASPRVLAAKGEPTPRVLAASWDFKLEPDLEAKGLWQTFADSPNPSGATADQLKIRDAARETCKHLNWLRLTVKSCRELLDEQRSCSKKRCLECYSPFSSVPVETKVRLIEAACGVHSAERSLGALVGMAVGDSAGAPFEFIDAIDDMGASGHYLELTSLKGVGERNKFSISPGQWTDDSSMGLCLADTLLARGQYDGTDSRIRYHNWWFRGYNNAFGNAARIGSVGLGGNVAQSLRTMEAGVQPSPAYQAVTQDAGNGSIMRLAPVPIFYALDPAQAAHISAQSSAATHPGPIAAAACAFQGFLIASCIQRGPEATTASAFLDKVVNDFISRGLPGAAQCPELLRLLKSKEPQGSKEECWNWRAPKLQIQRTMQARGYLYNGYPCYPDYFGSYCMDGLGVALWSFYHTSSFTEAIVRCVNFLGDADTLGAICGQIAGAFYGYKAIDSRWLELLAKWDDHDIACRAALLWALRNGTEVTHGL